MEAKAARDVATAKRNETSSLHKTQSAELKRRASDKKFKAEQSRIARSEKAEEAATAAADKATAAAIIFKEKADDLVLRTSDDGSQENKNKINAFEKAVDILVRYNLNYKWVGRGCHFTTCGFHGLKQLETLKFNVILYIQLAKKQAKNGEDNWRMKWDEPNAAEAAVINNEVNKENNTTPEPTTGTNSTPETTTVSSSTPELLQEENNNPSGGKRKRRKTKRRKTRSKKKRKTKRRNKKYIRRR